MTAPAFLLILALIAAAFAFVFLSADAWNDEWVRRRQDRADARRVEAARQRTGGPRCVPDAPGGRGRRGR